MAKKFQRHIEDFACEKCGTRIEGDGYTNHCPKCLWSKHVDVNPGDRAAQCGGMMEPIALEGANLAYDIVHRCTRCGCKRRNKVQDIDSTDAVVGLSQKFL